MIFKPRFPRLPPHGRIDQVIYWGAVPVPTDWNLYACDFDSGEVKFIEQSELDPMPASGPAGGDLSGTYPNPSVATVPDGALSANVPIMTAGVLPAVDGSLLTNLPGPAALQSGTASIPDVGPYSVPLSVGVTAVVACWRDAGPAGQLNVQSLGPTSFTIDSTDHAGDAEKEFWWIAF